MYSIASIEPTSIAIHISKLSPASKTYRPAIAWNLLPMTAHFSHKPLRLPSCAPVNAAAQHQRGLIDML